MNIYLIGFSGTGKTSSGLQAAKILNWRFLDTDKQIEIVQGKTIAQIFEEFGEDYFRSLETQILNETIQESKLIVSTGGGLPTQKENVEIMTKSGFIIQLTASAQTIYRRLTKSHQKNDQPIRPLIGNTITKQEINEFLAKRETVYSISNLAINTDNKNFMQVAHEIVGQWKRIQKGTLDI